MASNSLNIRHPLAGHDVACNPAFESLITSLAERSKFNQIETMPPFDCVKHHATETLECPTCSNTLNPLARFESHQHDARPCVESHGFI